MPTDHGTRSGPSLIWVGMLVLYVVWGSTYLAIAVAVDTFPPFIMAAIRFGLAGVLIFIGLKMTWLNPFPITWSLAIIAALVGGSIVASLIADRNRIN